MVGQGRGAAGRRAQGAGPVQACVVQSQRGCGGGGLGFESRDSSAISKILGLRSNGRKHSHTATSLRSFDGKELLKYHSTGPPVIHLNERPLHPSMEGLH